MSDVLGPMADDEAELAAIADEKECVVDYAQPDTLQLDIDSNEAMAVYADGITRLADMLPDWFKITGVLIRASRGGNRHVIVQLNRPLPVEWRILLQACLGSDPTRELLAFARHLKGNPKAIRLFRPKDIAQGSWQSPTLDEDDDLPF